MGLLWIERAYEEEGEDGQGTEETIERYRLEMDDVKDGKKEIRDAVSRPNKMSDGTAPPLTPYSPHPDNDTDQQIFVKTFRPVRQAAGSNIWDLEITYSSEVDLPDNPLNEPMEWDIDTDVQEELSFRDADGKPYLTTAGSLIETGNEVPRIVLSGSRAIPTNWPDWLLQYGGAVNEDDVRIKGKTWPALTLKITKLKIGKDATSPSGGSDYCQFNIELTYNKNGWQFEVPNRDFYQLIPRPPDKGSTKPTPAKKQKYDRVKIHVKNEHGVPEEPTEPQMIDKNGLLIPVPTTANIVVLTFNKNLRLPFSVLPLK
jgi:hypothetical protein